jgi:hypothetical protein
VALAGTWQKHGPLRDDLMKALRRPPEELFTFREFVRFLMSYDLDFGNLHIRRQTTLAERESMFSKLIVLPIEEGKTLLPNIERSLDLSASSPEDIWGSRHHTVRKQHGGFFADYKFPREHLVSSEADLPLTEELYDQDLFAAVRQLFIEDVTRYGYDRSWEEFTSLA